ncbi:MAG: cell division protein FtsZ [Ruminococcaceae bacterium]|nr:cell division protein FtsZ [Oscillospiraceae bacterium]
MFFDNFTPGQTSSFATKSNDFQQPSSPFGTPKAPASEPDTYVAPKLDDIDDDEDGGIDGWDLDDPVAQKVNIKVFGVGGGGNNAVNRMFLSGDKSAEMVVVNTDIAVLRTSPVKVKVAIGKNTTRGHGAGANPEAGKRAAEESIDLIKKRLENVDMLYITAGMGGGTGTGASPIIAKVAKDMGILTVAVVTKPFSFEGEVRMAAAEDGIEQLRQNVDAVIVVPNERLLSLSNKPLEIKEAFQAADEILIKGVQSICRLINDESYINLDFADVTTILRNSGEAHIGVGIASGDNKAMLAAEQAINSPLLETSIKEADGMIISIVAGESMTLTEVNEAAQMIKNECASSVKIIWGLKFDPEMKDSIEITVIATRNKEVYIGGDNNNEDITPVIDNTVVTPIEPTPAPAPVQKVQETPVVVKPVHQEQEVPAKPIEKETTSRGANPFLTENDFRFIRDMANNSKK